MKESVLDNSCVHTMTSVRGSRGALKPIWTAISRHSTHALSSKYIDSDTMVFYCWAGVADGGLTLSRHCIVIYCLLKNKRKSIRWKARIGGSHLEGAHWKLTLGRHALEAHTWKTPIGGSHLKGAHWRLTLGRRALETHTWKAPTGGSHLEGARWRLTLGRRPLEAHTWKARI